MANVRVASRYVKSLLELAVEQSALEEVNNDMNVLAATVKSNRDFVLMLNSPIVRHEKKLEILRLIFKGKVHALTMAIIEILTKKNRESLLPAIASEFRVAYNNYKGISKAFVTSTVVLEGELRNEIIALVKKLSNQQQVELEEKVDADLIGGFILQVGDQQIDTSIKSKLKSLKRKFGENPYVKEF